MVNRLFGFNPPQHSQHSHQNVFKSGIVTIALAVLTFSIANMFDYEAPELAIALRLLGGGTCLWWLFKRSVSFFSGASKPVHVNYPHHPKKRSCSAPIYPAPWDSNPTPSAPSLYPTLSSDNQPPFHNPGSHSHTARTFSKGPPSMNSPAYPPSPYAYPPQSGFPPPQNPGQAYTLFSGNNALPTRYPNSSEAWSHNPSLQPASVIHPARQE